MQRGQHISQKFETSIEHVKSLALEMGAKVIQQLDDAVKSVLTGDKALAENVIKEDIVINTLDVNIDEQCNRIIVQYQPAATDLRFIMAVIKITNDLERIGDEAKRIAKQTIDLSEKGLLIDNTESVENMHTRATQMLNRSLDAFMRRDVDEAFDVISYDVKVDKEYENLTRQQVTYMMEDPRKIPVALDMLWIARSLERVGDRSCNICEYVIYLVKGKDIRHISVADIEEHIN